jgi:hypothetical protein
LREIALERRRGDGGRPTRTCAGKKKCVSAPTRVTADSRQIRLLNVVADFNREALATRAARSWTADVTVALLDEVITGLGRRPTYIRRGEARS